MKNNFKDAFFAVVAFVKKHTIGTFLIALILTAIVVTFACKDSSNIAPADRDTVSSTVTSGVEKEETSKLEVSSPVEKEEQPGSKAEVSPEKEDVSSEVISSKDTTSKKEDTSSESTVSKDTPSKSETTSSEVVSNHKHSYTSKVVKPTCTQDGYTKHTCKCCESYKDHKTFKLGHLYTDWKVTKKATTTSTGIKECKCDRCGKGTITETIPKRKKVNGVSSKIEITTRFGNTQYTLGNAVVVDARKTWGDSPTITIGENNSMHVIYYNKKNKKIEFTVEQPGSDSINSFTILKDGTYVSQYIGACS